MRHLVFHLAKKRWRTFFKKNQIFTTLCMECAYIDNMKAAALRERDPTLAKLMSQNAMKHIGAIDQAVAGALNDKKRRYIRAICYKWLWLARGQANAKQDSRELAA